MPSRTPSNQSAEDRATSDAPAPLPANVSQNIESIVAFHEREQRKISGSQRRLEEVSRIMARPLYLTFLLSLVGFWIIGNAFGARVGLTPFDPPPFARLQGLLTLAALLTTTILLIAENRQAKVESQRAHLDLQVNLLTEQKVTKLIHLLEELRRDLPMVTDRHDAEVASLQAPIDTAQTLTALADVGHERGRKVAGDPAA